MQRSTCKSDAAILPHPTDANGPLGGSERTADACPPRVRATYVTSCGVETWRLGTGQGKVYLSRAPAAALPFALAADAKIVPVAPMSDRSGQRQCRRGVSGDVELDAAMALANMAGVSGPAVLPAVQPAAPQHGASREEEEELASTRLSLELGKVGIQASSCSSSSSAGCPSQQTRVAVAAPGGGGYGPRPRHTLTEVTQRRGGRTVRRVDANLCWLSLDPSFFCESNRLRRRPSGCGACSRTGSLRAKPYSAVRL